MKTRPGDDEPERMLIAWQHAVREHIPPGLSRDMNVRRIAKRGRHFGREEMDRVRSLMGPQEAYQVCGASLCLGFLDWWGWECRSDFIWEMCNTPWVYPRWDGVSCDLYLLAEQGIGDEIVFANAYAPLLEHNSDRVVVECDSRLIPAFERTFCKLYPHAVFESRWSDGEVGTSRPVDEWRGYHDAFMPCGNALKLYWRDKRDIRTPWIEMDEERVEKWRSFLGEHERPWVGLSWVGRQGTLDPSIFEGQRGTLLNLNYEDFDDMWHCVAALDRVDTVTNTTAHMSGSVGVPTNVIKPAPIYGDWRRPGEFNNRLCWHFGKLCRWLYPHTTVWETERHYETAKAEGFDDRYGRRRDRKGAAQAARPGA